MKKQLLWCMAALSFSAASAQTYETRFARPLSDVLNDVAARFQVRLKYDVDTVGRVLPYADFRIRPYSLEETLTNVLSPFDYKFVKQSDKVYKLKPYEYARRTDADGEKMLAYLSGLYSDKSQWEQRREILRKEVRQRLGLDDMLGKTVKDAKPVLSKIRKFDGYTVQNFALETLPGLYVCGSVYAPRTKGKHALIICPNGHFGQGRYRKDQQQRMATLARMGAVCVDYDLYGWGESALQVGGKAHHTADAHTIQAMNGIWILDYMLANRKDIDPACIGVNGGSGGGTQTVLLTVLDDRLQLPPLWSVWPLILMAVARVKVASPSSWQVEELAMRSWPPCLPASMLVVSDGGDWTATVPRLEYPYLQRIYGFYGATDKVSNVHLPQERHDFGPNKRNAVYDFFIDVFGLDRNMLDESKVTIEPENALKSFGEKGEKLPAGALRYKE